MAGEAEPGAGPDRKRYVITEAGATEFETWLAEPVAPEPHLQTVIGEFSAQPSRTTLEYEQLAEVVILVSLPIAGCTLAVSVAAGLFVSAQLGYWLRPPGAEYYVIALAGLAASLGIIASTLPVLDRITGPETARNE